MGAIGRLVSAYSRWSMARSSSRTSGFERRPLRATDARPTRSTVEIGNGCFKKSMTKEVAAKENCKSSLPVPVQGEAGDPEVRERLTESR
jgi:hypothetical protein